MTPIRYVLFACGQLGLMLLIRFFLSWVLKYADSQDDTNTVLFAAASVGAALLVARILDGVSDPLAGTISDGYVAKGRQRRKLLWFAFLAPPVGLVLSFLATHDMSVTLRWSLLIGGMTVFFAGYTFYAIPYWSLIEDYGGQDAGARRIMSNLLGAGILLAVAIIAVGSPGLIESQGYGKTAVMFALPATVLLILPYFAQPKPPKDGIAAAEPHSSSGKAPKLGLGAQLKEAFAHKRFLAFLIIFAGSQMAFTVVTLSAPFIAERLLGGSEKDVASMMTPFLGTAIPFFLLAPYLSRRFGWQRCIVVSSFLLALVYGGTAGLGSAVVGTAMNTTQILFGLAGPLAAVLLGLEGEAITDCARERGGNAVSLYFGVFNFVVKAMNGVATFLTSLLVALSQSEEWSVTAIRAMGIMAGGLLVLALGLYLVVRPKGARPEQLPVSPVL